MTTPSLKSKQIGNQMSVERDHLPLYERTSDYLYTMSALTRNEARRQWRAGIKSAWHNCCAYCNKPPIDDASLTIDHVKPKSKGGEDKTSNVIPACRSCNAAKGSEDWLSWYRDQPFYSVYSEWRIRNWLRSGSVDNLEDDAESCKFMDNFIDKIFNAEPRPCPHSQ